MILSDLTVSHFRKLPWLPFYGWHISIRLPTVRSLAVLTNTQFIRRLASCLNPLTNTPPMQGIRLRTSGSLIKTDFHIFNFFLISVVQLCLLIV